MLKRKIISLLVIMTLGSAAFAQSSAEGIYSNFERNYDELLHSYYMQTNEKMLNERFSDNTIYGYASAASVSDDVYRQRLKSIPSCVKLVYNKEVRQQIVYYIDRIGKRVGVMLGMSKYYFPIFENILDSYGVPADLKYLVVIESAFHPCAVSNAGATGLWQFMYATGRTYGLRVNSVVDDRRDPIKATVAAAKFLKDLYGMYGDWSLVLAAYNCGPGNVNKAIKRSGGKTDFWEIYPYLPKETRGYVPAFIAATYIMNFYNEHGIRPANLSQPYSLVTDTVMLSKDVFFGQISSVMNIPVQELKELNPQYKTDMIPGSQGSYSLKLPLRYINTFIGLEDSIANYDKEKYYPELRKDTIDAGEVTYVSKTIYHKVRKGDSWHSIARRYGVSQSELRQWNRKLKKNRLKTGTMVAVQTKVAVAKDKIITEDAVDSTSSFEDDRMLSADNQQNQEDISATSIRTRSDKVTDKKSGNKTVDLKSNKKDSKLQQDKAEVNTDKAKSDKNESKKADRKADKKQKSGKSYTIKSGDTIGKIARKNNMTEEQLLKANGLTKESAKKIRPGQKIKL